jgi:hypothetical protein
MIRIPSWITFCSLWLIVILFQSVIFVGECKILFGGINNERTDDSNSRKGGINSHHDDYEHTHSLVETVGKAIYRQLDRPKYRFYMFMTVGKLNEQSTILLLSSLCNALYGILVLIGFLLLPRERMLIITALTLYVGPSIILLLVGGFVLLVASFALYPVISVLVVWIWFFLTSHVAQVLGKSLGLDSNEDGNVDMLDLIYYFANTRWGEWIGLRRLHTYLKCIPKDPFEEIKERLDHLTEKLNETVSSITNGSIVQQSASSEGIEDYKKIQ